MAAAVEGQAARGAAGGGAGGSSTDAEAGEGRVSAGPLGRRASAGRASQEGERLGGGLQWARAARPRDHARRGIEGEAGRGEMRGGPASAHDPVGEAAGAALRGDAAGEAEAGGRVPVAAVRRARTQRARRNAALDLEDYVLSDSSGRGAGGCSLLVPTCTLLMQFDT